LAGRGVAGLGRARQGKARLGKAWFQTLQSLKIIIERRKQRK